MECPVCKKEFDEKTGRRPKKFCSDACKVKFWNAFKKTMKGIEDPHQDTQKWVDSNLNEIPKEKEPLSGTAVTLNISTKSRIQELMEQAERELKSKK